MPPKTRLSSGAPRRAANHVSLSNSAQNTSDNAAAPAPATSSPQPTPSATASQTRRPVTRGVQPHLSASLRALPRNEVIDKIKNTTLQSIIRITRASPPDFVEVSHTTRVVALNGLERVVEFFNDDDDTPRQMTIPFAHNCPNVITRIESSSLNPLHVTPTASTRPVDPSHPTIFFDGGSQPNPGPSAAAFHVVATDQHGNTTTVMRRSQYYPRATNNQVEAIGSVAALRQAKRMLEENPTQPVNVVGDSRLIFDGITGTSKIKDPKLAPHVEVAAALYRSMIGWVTLCHMHRDCGNPSDKDCNEAIRTGKGNAADFGDAHMFPDIDGSHIPRAPPVSAPKPAASISVDLPSDTSAVPQNLQQFAAMYRYKNRDNVPDHCVHLWSQLVHHQLQRFASAPKERKEEELIRFIMHPKFFLPRNASASRVLSHLQRGVPFATTMESERRPRQHAEQHRLTEAITRLAGDHHMRRANQLMSSAADSPEVPHAEKVEGMKKKILPGAFQTSIDRKTVPMFSNTEVANALSKCSKQAANAVDGWSRRLLEQAISVNREILSLLANLLHFIMCEPLSPFLRQVIDLSRGVALTKPDGSGIRPICISSIFLKMLGLISAERDGTKPSELQYAIGSRDGARRIIHKVRNFIKHNPDGAVLRFDISNAYGTLPRDILQDIVKSMDPTMQQYFRLVYGDPTSVALFGPDETAFIPLGEGVKQGDSTSSLLFCLGVDRALKMIQAAFARRGIRAEIYMYMDDLTICVHSTDANDATRETITAFQAIGLKINEDKSKVLTDAAGSYLLPQVHHTSEFVILGANIATGPNAYDAFIKRLIKRQENYFELLDKTPLHPQIKATILRICGHPRILYHCATTPPRYMAKVADYFDSMVIRLYEFMIDASGRTKIPADIAHDVGGLGVPHYSANLNEIFGAFERMSLEDDPSVPRVSLTTTSLDTTTTQAQVDSQWMFYEAADQLTPAQFCNALGIRLNIIPRHLQLISLKCNCGHLYTSHDDESLHHVFTCGKATPNGFTYRHNLVRDTIINVARDFGITTSREPTCYTYSNGLRQRPDVLFHTEPNGIAIDVSLISVTHVADDIQEAEKKKTTTHRDAVQNANHVFFPFVMATRGTLGSGAEKLIRTLARAVQPYQQRTFSRRLHHAVAVAAAKGRSDALAAIQRQQMW